MDFEEIYKRHFKAVYLYILRLSGDEHLAEDITAETFFKALKAIDRFRGDCDVRVWLCHIAKNCYISHCRKASRQSDFWELMVAVLHSPINLPSLSHFATDKAPI